MATITPANALALADSVATRIIARVALIGSPSALQAGQATMLARIAALNDYTQQQALLDGFSAAVANENAAIAKAQAYTTILDDYFAACAALDVATGGYGAMLQANSQQVDPHFLDAWNRAASRGLTAPAKALGAFLAFGPAQSPLASITVTGSGAGTFAAGTAIPATYGNAPLSVYNAGSGATGAASGTYTVTYNAYNSSGVLQTGLTQAATVPNGTAVGGAVSLGISGIAVTNITLTGGNSGDVIGVKSTLLRTATY